MRKKYIGRINKCELEECQTCIIYNSKSKYFRTVSKYMFNEKQCNLEIKGQKYTKIVISSVDDVESNFINDEL